MSLAAATRLGPDEILGLIGAGGMGEVYKARDTRLDRTVAIKVLPAEISTDPERRARFEREARTARIDARDHAAAGVHDLELVWNEAVKRGILRYEFEARRAIVEIEGSRSAAGAAHATSLHDDARARGFLLYAPETDRAASRPAAAR